MDEESIQQIVAEIQPLLTGRLPGRILQLDALTVIIDFHLRDHRTLLISVNPSLPRIHLTKRRFHDRQTRSIPVGQFALTLRKQLSNSRLISIVKIATDRIIVFEFDGEDEAQRARHAKLVAQLTGRSANLFLLNPDDFIGQRLRATDVEGQQVGKTYKPPRAVEQKQIMTSSKLLEMIESGQFPSASEAADTYYQSLVREKEFDQKAAGVRARLKGELARTTKLLKKLENDVTSHAGAEQQKRIGDLLLANVSSAERSGGRVKLVDYFDSRAPTIELEIDERVTLAEEASRRFALYSRSKRALGQIASRLEKAKADIAGLRKKQHELDRIIAARDVPALEGWAESPAVAGSLTSGTRRKRVERIPGARRYISTDGFEIFVGRAAKDNDHLTFKVARPNDLWLHSADYPGSHVIVRNPTRKELPHRTIIEAAQLAAYFSQASKNPKVDVNYSQRKFLSKPKGAAPGLVRMSRFKTITVNPSESIERL